MMKTAFQIRPRWGRILLIGMFATVALLIPRTGFVQTLPSFDSGSTGADGPLSLTIPGTYFFDPNDVATFGRVLDADGDGIFQFTTITIAAGVRLTFKGDRYNRPVYWLASSNVVINGFLELAGDRGGYIANAGGDPRDRQNTAVPGSGGFGGGGGGLSGASAVPATSGEGPGGGSISEPCLALPDCGQGGIFAGTNRYLVPLIGGSGGRGAVSPMDLYGGGAGGGAILIASSGSIIFGGNSFIDVSGGAPGGLGFGSATPFLGPAGAGSGGAVRLVARTIENSSRNINNPELELRVDAFGYPADECSLCAATIRDSSMGRVRIEAFQVTHDGIPLPTSEWASSLAWPATAASIGVPRTTYLQPQSSVRVVSVDGLPVSLSPLGKFLSPPDVSINQTTAVPVVVQGNGIPPNTPIQIIVSSDNLDNPQEINKTYNGTLNANLQATVSVLFPTGLSRFHVRVTWPQ